MRALAILDFEQATDDVHLAIDRLKGDGYVVYDEEGSTS